MLVLIHHIQWKLEFINIVCGSPEQPTFFSYGDVRNQLSWPKAKQTCKSQISRSGQSGDCYQLHKLWWEDHSRDAASLHPTQEKISSALDQYPASICNLMFFLSNCQITSSMTFPVSSRGTSKTSPVLHSLLQTGLLNAEDMTSSVQTMLTSVLRKHLWMSQWALLFAYKLLYLDG